MISLVPRTGTVGTMLAMTDLSAVFDTADHGKLLTFLQDEYGVSEVAHD